MLRSDPDTESASDIDDGLQVHDLLGDPGLSVDRLRYKGHLGPVDPARLVLRHAHIEDQDKTVRIACRVR